MHFLRRSLSDGSPQVFNRKHNHGENGLVTLQAPILPEIFVLPVSEWPCRLRRCEADLAQLLEDPLSSSQIEETLAVLLPSYLAMHACGICWQFTAKLPKTASGRRFRPEAKHGKVKAANLRYRFKQDPGPLNALGRIKFMFPNQFGVYLHDTPSKELFAKARRDFSSGCADNDPVNDNPK